MKIREKLLLSYLVIAGIVMLAIAMLAYDNTRNILIDLVNKEMTLTVDDYANRWNSWLQHKIDLVRHTHDIIVTEGNISPLSVRLLKLYAPDHQITDFYIGLHDGKLYDGSGWVPPKGFNIVKRPWYVSAVQAKQLVVSEPYKDAITGKMCVTIDEPVYASDGSLKGVIGADILIETITNEIDDVNLEGHGSGFLIDTTGVFIAHPNKSKIFTNIKNDRTYAALTSVIMKRPSGTITFAQSGKEYLLTFQRLGYSKWILVLSIEKSVAYAKLTSLRLWTFVISAVIFVLIVTCRCLTAL